MSFSDRKRWMNRVFDVNDPNQKETYEEIRKNGLLWYQTHRSAEKAQSIWKLLDKNEKELENFFDTIKILSTWRFEETDEYISGKRHPDCTTIPYAIRALDYKFLKWCANDLPKEQQLGLFSTRNVVDAFLTGDNEMLSFISTHLLNLYPEEMISQKTLDEEIKKCIDYFTNRYGRPFDIKFYLKGGYDKLDWNKEE